MSYLLEFPIKPLPENVHSPPYVLFGITGQNIAEDLPPYIPLNMVTHFAPKLKQWVLPPPSTSQLPWTTAKLALRTPHVGIDILSDDVEAPAMKYIISKMLLASGLSRPSQLFLMQPSTSVALSIHKTWLALDLPLAGIQALHIHIQSQLSFGPPVTFPEMVTIWGIFPHTSQVVRAMGVNFIHSHIRLDYNRFEFNAARDWYLSSEETSVYFLALENEFPAFGEMQAQILKAVREKAVLANLTVENEVTPGNAEGQNMQKKLEVRNVSREENNPQSLQAGTTKRIRSRRTKSEHSISVETGSRQPSNPTGSEALTKSDNGNDSDTSSESRTSSKQSDSVLTGRQRSSLSRPLEVDAVIKRLLDLRAD